MSPRQTQHGADAFAGQMPKVWVDAYPAAEWPRLSGIWAELFSQSGSQSVFLTGEWTSTWLEMYGRRLGFSILVFGGEPGPVGICLLTESRRYGALRIRHLALNASGEAVQESTYIEHNHVLCRPGWEGAVGRRLAGYVTTLEWDEFALDGMSDGALYQALKEALAGVPREEDLQHSYNVDLEALRRRQAPYEAVLRSRYRVNLHRAIRDYERFGTLTLERAADSARALEMLDELGALSRRRVASQGGASTFESRRFVEFHRRLIARCFGNGSIAMLRVAAGNEPVGIIYGLVQAGKVHEYQCGCRYPEGANYSPGIVAHAMAIQHCLERGYDEWDFLAGDVLPKRSLATGSRNLYWTVFRRPSARTRILAAGRRLRRWMRGGHTTAEGEK